MNKLSEARKRIGISQVEAAAIIGVSRRSYQSFENDENKQNTYKFDYFVSVLEKENQIYEEHGILCIKKLKRFLILFLRIKTLNLVIYLAHTLRAKQQEKWCRFIRYKSIS